MLSSCKQLVNSEQRGLKIFTSRARRLARLTVRVTRSIDEEGSGKAHAERCAGCGAALSAAQRYCLECGIRRGPLPAMVANRIDALKRRGRPAAPKRGGSTAGSAAATAAAKKAKAEEDEDGLARFMPSPQIAAVAVMALLAAGVVIGSVTSPLAESAGSAPIVLEMPPPASSPPESGGESAASAAFEPTPLAPTAEAPLAAPLEAPAAEPEPSAPPKAPLELPEEETLPEIKHVFLIVLDGHGYEEAFGTTSSLPYLAQTLAAKGELLPNYYAVAPGALANEMALISGQGPTPQTAANCPEYTAIAPGTVGEEGQVEGQGCVYPSTVQTLPGQLAAAGLTWKAYVEDIANGAATGQPTACRHPALGSPDPSQAPVPGDAYETWRNPFVYFAGLTEGPECGEADVSLDRLAPDLKKAEKTPALSYIVPNACHDGSEAPCAPEQPAGLAGAEPFLKAVVPEIEASPAYQEAGLIAITFDQAPQAGPSADSSSCCATPEYPNLPPPAAAETPASGPVKPSGGGGRVGLLLISPYVEPGSVEESGYYNHFSLLRSIEELLGQEPLGYAASPALTGFESSVFNASPEESTVSEPARG
jgi:phosphatidylinositol-3-phosphatase